MATKSKVYSTGISLIPISEFHGESPASGSKNLYLPTITSTSLILFRFTAVLTGQCLPKPWSSSLTASMLPIKTPEGSSWLIPEANRSEEHTSELQSQFHLV